MIERWACEAVMWAEAVTGLTWGKEELDAAMFAFFLAALIVLKSFRGSGDEG